MAEAKHVFITEEATAIIRGPRNVTYGSPRVNFKKIVDGMNGYGFRVVNADGTTRRVNMHDYAMFMVITKVMRQATGNPHRDSLVDIVGYAELDEIVTDDDAHAAFLSGE